MAKRTYKKTATKKAAIKKAGKPTKAARRISAEMPTRKTAARKLARSVTSKPERRDIYLQYSALFVEDLARLFTFLEEIKREVAISHGYLPDQIIMAVSEVETGQSIKFNFFGSPIEIGGKTPKAVMIHTLVLSTIITGFSLYNQQRKAALDREGQAIENMGKMVEVRSKQVDYESKLFDLEEKKSKKKSSGESKRVQALKKTQIIPVQQNVTVNVNADTASINLAQFLMENSRIKGVAVNGQTLKNE